MKLKILYKKLDRYQILVRSSCRSA